MINQIRVIRAPMPWHDSFIEAKRAMELHLFVTHPVMLDLQKLWIEKYFFHFPLFLFKIQNSYLFSFLINLNMYYICRFSQLRFVHPDKVLAHELPMMPNEFEDFVRKLCEEINEILRKKCKTSIINIILSNAFKKFSE